MIEQSVKDSIGLARAALDRALEAGDDLWVVTDNIDSAIRELDQTVALLPKEAEVETWPSLRGLRSLNL